LIRIIIYGDLGTRSRLLEEGVKGAALKLARRYGLSIEVTVVLIPEIDENFKPSIKVNSGKAEEVEMLDEDSLEEFLLAEMSGGFNPIISLDSIRDLAKAEA
jgi:hypothetical protein